MLNVVKYSEFAVNVTAVYSHPLWIRNSSVAHYSGNAETHMNIIGEAR